MESIGADEVAVIFGAPGREGRRGLRFCIWIEDVLGVSRRMRLSAICDNALSTERLQGTLTWITLYKISKSCLILFSLDIYFS